MAKRISLILAAVCILGSLCARGQTPGKALSGAEELELKTLAGQLTDPTRDAKTKMEASELLLNRSYDQATDALKLFLSDSQNRPAQIAVAEAVAKFGEGRAEFIEPLMTMLTGDEATVRGPAARALAVYKNNGVIGRLVEIAQDRKRDQAVRLEVINALQRVLDKAAVDALVQLLDDPEATVVSASAESLAKLTNIRAFGADRQQWRNWWQKNSNKPRSEWLADLADSLGRSKTALEGENAKLRDRLAKAMEDLYTSTPAAQRDAMVITFLKDPLTDVRLVGVRLVGRKLTTGDKVSPEIRAQVRSMLGDLEIRVRKEAAVLASTLGDAEAAGALQDRLKTEDSPEVRKAVLTALGQLGDPNALPAVLAEIDSAQEDVAGAAAGALSRLAGKQPLEGRLRKMAVAALLKRYPQKDKPDEGTDVRESLLAAMGTLADEEFVPVLRNALKDPSASIRLVAVNGLRQFGKGDLAAAIEPLVNDTDRGVRQAVVVALGTLDGEKSLSVILQRTDPATETDASVRQQAWDAAMAILSKADVKSLARAMANLSARVDAVDQRIKIQQMLVAAYKTSKSAELPGALRQLGRELVAASRPAEAAPQLAEAAAAYSASNDRLASAVWSEWVDALLEADDPTVTKVLAEQADAKLLADGMKRLWTRLDTCVAKGNYLPVVQLSSASLTNLGKRLNGQQTTDLEKLLNDAKLKQLAADRQKVATLVPQLVAADEAARKASATELGTMGERALGPLLGELKKAIGGDTENRDMENAVLAVLKQLAPNLTGYDTAATKADRVKIIDGWLKF